MAHTLTEADQIQRPGLTGEAAHDDVCSWLGFHSGPTLTDGIPALAGMYLHLAGILRAELPEFQCLTPGAAFVVEGWERESEATRQLYGPETGLLPQALRATKVGSVDHRDLTLAAALAADLDQLNGYGLDPDRPETFAGMFTRARYWPATRPFTAQLLQQAMELSCPPHASRAGAQRRLPAGLVGQLAFRQAPTNGQGALVTFESWVSEELCERTTRDVVEPSIRAAASKLQLGSADLEPSRTVRADLLSIMLPSAGSYYVAAATYVRAHRSMRRRTRGAWSAGLPWKGHTCRRNGRDSLSTAPRRLEWNRRIVAVTLLSATTGRERPAPGVELRCARPREGVCSAGSASAV